MTIEAISPYSLPPPTILICPSIGDEQVVVRNQKPLEDHYARKKRLPLIRELGITRKQLGPELFKAVLNGRYEDNIKTQLAQQLPADSISRIGVLEEQIKDNLENNRAQSINWLPLWLRKNYQERTKSIQSVLEEEGSKLPDLLGRSTWDSRKRTTREILHRLFPELKKLDLQTEKCIFAKKSIEQYIDDVAIPHAFGFWDWLTAEQLPPEISQPLSLSDGVRSAKSLLDLIYIFSRKKTVEINIGQSSPVFDLREKWEAGVILDFVYLAVVADLARHPLEDTIMNSFVQDVANVLPADEIEWHLLYDRDKQTGFCARLQLTTQAEKGSLESTGGHYGDDMKLTPRRWGNQTHDVAIFDTRRKGVYERMLKLWRNRRYPLNDLLGVRFILPDKSQRDGFITALQAKLRDWVIKPEEDRMSSPQSVIREDFKYQCYHADHPDCKIEIQTPWLTDHQMIGNAVTLSLNPYTCPKAYKVKQLYDILPSIAPADYYHINWFNGDGSINEDIYLQLLRHANKSLFD